MFDTEFGWIAPVHAPEENFTTGFAYQEYISAKGADAPLPYTVTEYSRSYTFAAPVIAATLAVTADAEFRLWSVEETGERHLLATGPANPGGDFRDATALRPVKYATPISFVPHCPGCTLHLVARVKGMPVYISEYSFGKTGLWLQGTVTLQDGKTERIGTDTGWTTRALPAYRKPFVYDNRLEPGTPAAAVPLVMPVSAETAIPQRSPIPPRSEQIIYPNEPGGIVTVAPGHKQLLTFSFDKIYAAYPEIEATYPGACKNGPKKATFIRARFYETEENGTVENLTFCKTDCYTALQLHSVGAAELSVENNTDYPIQIRLALRATCFPVTGCAKTETSDENLNKLLQICTHTLQYCRQQIHLDSPRHCEPLACTGDYYIQTLMTAFSFGDMRLARFDAVRTADILRQQNGEMFHTTYSLIWVLMLWDIYQFTGDVALLRECEDALALLLARFDEYNGETGLPETPPSFMFVDWLFIDGISLHHPPKALGQGCLAMFLYGALCVAQKIYSVLEQPDTALVLQKRAAALYRDIRTHLWDEENQLFIAGLNTPTPKQMLHTYMPQNTHKCYRLPHANILAILFGVCDAELAPTLLQRITDGELGEVQPYFAHFLFEAVYHAGLRSYYTLPLAAKWYDPIAACGKGLPEGFIPPEPGYTFDHSHAWGGSPLWSVPLALTGLQIITPGMSSLAFDFDLLGLDAATVELPTPYGTVTCILKKGEIPVVTAPPQITLNYETKKILQ